MQQLVQPSGPHRWVDEESAAKTAEQCRLLEMVLWLSGTWAGNANTRMCMCSEQWTDSR